VAHHLGGVMTYIKSVREANTRTPIIYIKGREAIDGSIRLNVNNGVLAAESRSGGVWISEDIMTSFSGLGRILTNRGGEVLPDSSGNLILRRAS